VIDPKEALARHKPRCSSSLGSLNTPGCAPLALSDLTIQIDEALGTSVVRNLEAKNGSKLGTPANDRTNIDIA
jgi:hypothetical protein